MVENYCNNCRSEIDITDIYSTHTQYEGELYCDKECLDKEIEKRYNK